MNGSVFAGVLVGVEDLWPPLGRFKFVAGQRVAWSGQSGAGPPHLHVEVRHGDMAINPLIAGLAVPDTVAPRLERLILEPLDEESWVARHAGPYSLTLGARAPHDTLVVEGHVRVTLLARDATNEARNLPVLTVGARWNGACSAREVRRSCSTATRCVPD